jgi:hypothetical protein
MHFHKDFLQESAQEFGNGKMQSDLLWLIKCTSCINMWKLLQYMLVKVTYYTYDKIFIDVDHIISIKTSDTETAK